MLEPIRPALPRTRDVLLPAWRPPLAALHPIVRNTIAVTAIGLVAEYAARTLAIRTLDAWRPGVPQAASVGASRTIVTEVVTIERTRRRTHWSRRRF